MRILWAPLALVLSAPGEEIAPKGAPISSGELPGGRAERAPRDLRESSHFPRRFEWGFETVDESGRELYAMPEVPIFLGDRPTQPDWVQEFGRRADPARRDRFPREPAATFSSVSPLKGNRSLHLQSRGDSSLVHLARPIPLTGGIRLHLEAQVKLQGIREGALQFRILFSGEGLPGTQGRIEFPPLRGDHDFREVEFQGEAPERAEFLTVEILLQGSYRDGEIQAWVDSLVLLLAPGFRIDWGGRKILLFGTGDREIPLEIEARGMAPGAYGLEGELERLSMDGLPSSPPLTFQARRYARQPLRDGREGGPAADLSGEDPPNRSGGTAPRKTPFLRFRGDLRELFSGASLPSGLCRLTIRLRHLGDSVPGESGSPLAEHVERLGFLPGTSDAIALRGVRLGIPWTADDARSGWLAELGDLPSGFPITMLLWDLAGKGIGGEAPVLPPEVKLPSEKIPLTWKGRLGPEILKGPAAPERLKGWSSRILAWEVLLQVGDRDGEEALRKVRENCDFLSLGSPVRWGGPPGKESPSKRERPSWASFQVLELGQGRGSWGGAGDPPPDDQDWVIADVPRLDGLSEERDELAAFSGLLLSLSLSGHRHIFFRGAMDLLFEKRSAGRRSPRLPAFAWAGLGRILAGGEIRGTYDWDQRGIFLCVSGDGGHSLIAMSRGDEAFKLGTWTGTPLAGEDLLGDPVPSYLDEETGVSEILVPREPAIYRGFDPGLIATVRSLALLDGGLIPGGEEQEVQLTVKNLTEGPVIFELSMALPRALIPGKGPGPLSVLPGGEGLFRFPIRAREDPKSGKIVAAFVLHLERGGRKSRFLEEKILEVRSRFIRLLQERYDPERGKLLCTVENLSPAGLTVHLYSRVFLGGSQDLLESRDERLGPGESREVSIDLSLPPKLLEGKEVLIGAEVRGRNESISERYHLKSVRGKLALVPE